MSLLSGSTAVPSEMGAVVAVEVTESRRGCKGSGNALILL